MDALLHDAQTQEVARFYAAEARAAIVHADA